MANLQRIGDAVSTLVQTYGEDILQDAFTALETFAQITPGAREEKSLLQALLLCDGLNHLRRARAAAPDKREDIVEPLVERMCRDFDLPEETAAQVVREVYRGLTGNNWAGGAATPVVTAAPVVKTPSVKEPPVRKPAAEETTVPPEKPARERKWMMPVLLVLAGAILVLLVVLLLSGGEAKPGTQPATQPLALQEEEKPEQEAHVHVWADATCTAPKVCTGCGEMVGEPAGHLWQEASCAVAKNCLRCGEITGSPLNHVWSGGSCTQYATCVNCGSVSDQLSDHIWMDATCYAPKTCGVCALTEGTPLVHVWQEAWYETPETCVLCGLTEGFALLHDPDMPYDNKINVVLSYYKDVYNARHEDKYEKVRIRSGLYVYYDENGKAVYLDVSQGIEGLGGYGAYYNRMYYLSEGKLVFAFFEGDDEHRLYFYEETLLRWSYRPYAGAESILHDQENTFEYHFWEQLALEEVQALSMYLQR